MADLTSEIARKAGIKIETLDGEVLTDKVLELASDDWSLTESVRRWFNLSIFQVTYLISEYKKQKKKNESANISNNAQSAIIEQHEELKNQIRKEEEEDEDDLKNLSAHGESSEEDLLEMNQDLSGLSIGSPVQRAEEIANSVNRAPVELLRNLDRRSLNIISFFEIQNQLELASLKEFQNAIKIKALEIDKAKIIVRSSIKKLQ